MAVNPLSLASPLLTPTPATTARGAGSGGASFANLVDRVLSSAGEIHQQTEATVNDLALGRSDNVHGALMQVAQADLTFRLILEVRNRLTDAYQEIMKMQV